MKQQNKKSVRKAGHYRLKKIFPTLNVQTGPVCLRAGISSPFTLIELLMVVAIITVLLAILLPSLHNAKDSARAIVCGSNLKQLGIALSAYASSYDGFCPREDLDNGGCGTTWMGKIIPEYLPPLSSSTPSSEGENTSLTLQCPLVAPLTAYWMSCYALNFNLSGLRKSPAAADSWEPKIRLNRVRNTAALMLAMDGVKNTYRRLTPDDITYTNAGIYVNLTGSPKGERICRHPQISANVLYCDGHVARHRSNFLLTHSTSWTDPFWYPGN